MSQLDTDEMIERRTVHQEVNLNDLNDRVDAVEANKSADIEADSGNAAKYPSVPAVETYVATHGGGLSVEAIDGLPTAANFHNGDRLIVSKGVEPATLIGTCSGVSSNPNVTIIGDASVSVDSGLNAVDFAAAIVAALDNPTALQDMKASSIDDNGDGTFEVDFYPGVFGNSVVASGSDNNPSFAVTYPGSSELEQVDKSSLGLQDKLVSGTNIKTVGGVSLLGSGDVPAAGGSSPTGKQIFNFSTPAVAGSWHTVTPLSGLFTVKAGKNYIFELSISSYPEWGVPGSLSAQVVASSNVFVSGYGGADNDTVAVGMNYNGTPGSGEAVYLEQKWFIYGQETDENINVQVMYIGPSAPDVNAVGMLIELAS